MQGCMDAGKPASQHGEMRHWRHFPTQDRGIALKRPGTTMS